MNCYKYVWLLEAICYVAVDGFVLISGYTSKCERVRIRKYIMMWLQAEFYSCFLSAILYLLDQKIELNISNLMRIVFPITANTFWFITSYIGMQIFVPFLFPYIQKVEKIKARRVLVCLLIIYSMWGVLNDQFETNWGYSTFWFILLYLMGFLARKSEIFDSLDSYILILIYAVCIGFSYLIWIELGVRRILNYNSPMIVISAMVLVILFSRFDGKWTIVRKISPLVLGVYYFHSNPIICNSYLHDKFAIYSSYEPLVCIFHVIMIVIVFYVVGLIVEYVRQYIERITKVSECVDSIISMMIGKISKGMKQ